MSPDPYQSAHPQPANGVDPYSAAYGQALTPPNTHADKQARDSHGRWVRGHGGMPKHTQSPNGAIEHTLETVQWGLQQAVHPGDSPKQAALESVGMLESLYPRTPVWPVSYAGQYHAIADLGTRFVDVVIDQGGTPSVVMHEHLPKELNPQHTPMT